MIKTTFNILAICGAAGFAGVMLCNGVTLGGYWRSLPAQAFMDWFATNNQFVSRSIPLVFMPTLIGMAGSVWLSWGSPDLKYWLLSTFCIVVVAILTFTFFVPTNTAFASGTMDEVTGAAKLNQWLMIHYFRIGFGMAAAVLGCIAIKA
ncbi:anthrone oxygenase family protein [Halocynthiibacter namhaensis]|uniref:anthrone oxygenase family protein n=1 Tax=Halocynthiibacter namhaensis TaxID=1290553 RepID=UPI000578EBB6|nr:DUF1772 domain-containing protein [Halocynthiibacter namhaensis]